MEDWRGLTHHNLSHVGFSIPRAQFGSGADTQSSLHPLKAELKVEYEKMMKLSLTWVACGEFRAVSHK